MNINPNLMKTGLVEKYRRIDYDKPFEIYALFKKLRGEGIKEIPNIRIQKDLIETIKQKLGIFITSEMEERDEYLDQYNATDSFELGERSERIWMVYYLLNKLSPLNNDNLDMIIELFEGALLLEE